MVKYSSGLNNVFNHNKYKGADFGKDNEKLVDTSGYVPLKIRLKKLDLAAAAAQLSRMQFDYHEYEELYDDDVVFDKFDDADELQSKIDLFNSKRRDLLERKAVAYYESHPEAKAALLERQKIARENYLKQQADALKNQQNSTQHTETPPSKESSTDV